MTHQYVPDVNGPHDHRGHLRCAVRDRHGRTCGLPEGNRVHQVDPVEDDTARRLGERDEESTV